MSTLDAFGFLLGGGLLGWMAGWHAGARVWRERRTLVPVTSEVGVRAAVVLVEPGVDEGAVADAVMEVEGVRTVLMWPGPQVWVQPCRGGMGP